MSGFNERAGFMFEPVKSVSNEVVHGEELPMPCQKINTKNGDMTWCRCFACELMPSSIENICCFNDVAVRNKMKDKECITMTSTFKKICLDTEVLEVFLSLLCDVVAEDSPTQYTNRNFRYAAYRSFIHLIYGKLGKKRRKVIPCCAVLAIRRTFPEENGVYEGFHEVSISLGVNSFK